MTDWTLSKVLEWTTDRFARAGILSARLDAQLLLAHVLQCDRVGLYTNFDKPLAALERSRYRELIRRRLAGEPTAYLVGHVEFWSLPFCVNSNVLIPRADTETLVEAVLAAVPDKSSDIRVVDVATGSGAVAIALAHELPNARFLAVDISPPAVALARHNAQVNKVAERVQVRVGDLLAVQPQNLVDVVVANLPYIPTGEIACLMTEVQHEPRIALDGGEDGLALFRRLLPQARDVLRGGGLLALEHGFDQGQALTALVDATESFADPTLRYDLAGNPRVLTATRNPISRTS